MQRIFLWGVGFFVALGAALGVYLYVSLIPFFHEIGIAMTALVIVAIGCAAILLVSFTWSRVGQWNNRRRVIVAGEVVVYLDRNGAFTHLSAQHEMAKLPPPAPPIIVDETPGSSDDVVLELWGKGLSLRTIEKATGRKYHEIQKITSAAKNK